MAQRPVGEKPTCYICDAAITEISQSNSDEDKEIDKLYESRPTQDRLNRARAKKERKDDEEAFANNPRQGCSTSTRESGSPNGSTGSGDALFHRNGDSEDEPPSNDHQDSCGYFGTFRIIHDNEDGYYSSTDDYHIEGDESRNEFNRPVVIHQTVEHVYHTIEVHNPPGANRDESRRYRCLPSSDRREYLEGLSPFQTFQTCQMEPFTRNCHTLEGYHSPVGIYNYASFPYGVCQHQPFASCHLMGSPSQPQYFSHCQTFRPWSACGQEHGNYTPYTTFHQNLPDEEQSDGQYHDEYEFEFNFEADDNGNLAFTYDDTGDYEMSRSAETATEGLERSSYENLSSMGTLTASGSDEIVSTRSRNEEGPNDDDEEVVRISVSLTSDGPGYYREERVEVDASHGLLDFRDSPPESH